MSKLIDFVDFLIIAILIAICAFVATKAFKLFGHAQAQKPSIAATLDERQRPTVTFIV